MRRALRVAAVALGVIVIALAAVVKWVVAPALVKVPLDVDRTTIATGASQVFILSKQAVEPVDVTATRVVRGDESAGTDSVAVFDESLCLRGPGSTQIAGNGCVPSTDPSFVLKTTDRVAFDRKTALAVADSGQFGTNVDGDKSIKHEGLGYTFPIDTRKETYPFFDTVVGKAYPMRFVGVEKLHGTSVYRFTQEVPRSEIKINGVLPGTYSNTRIVWVEPTTGVIVKGSEEIEERFSSTGGIAFTGTLVFTDETVRSQVDYANDQRLQVQIIRWWAPLALLIIGVVLAALGAWRLYATRSSESPPDAPLQPQDDRTGRDPAALG